MDRKYIPELPVPIIDAALEHVRTKYRVDLNRDLLTELYWSIRWRKAQLVRAKKRNKDLKVSAGFYAARDWILDQRFPQRRREDQLMRGMYASALGKIGNEFRKRSEPSFHLNRSERDRIMDLVTLDKDRRQYRFIV